jgi:hypothetical protein
VIGHLDDVAMLAVSCAMVVFLGLPELIKTFACKLIALDPPETLGLP